MYATCNEQALVFQLMWPDELARYHMLEMSQARATHTACASAPRQLG